MPDLLQIGGITDQMRERLEAAFTLHQLDSFDADKITHVVTNGHDGVNPDLMASLPNLKVISGYGVGYDAVDANEAARRGIIVTHTPNVLNEEVATTALLLMLSCYREVLRDGRRRETRRSRDRRTGRPLASLALAGSVRRLRTSSPLGTPRSFTIHAPKRMSPIHIMTT
jgi:lactate dehydrogenase-like 2-hydroxyacid dehydrogenase